MIKHERQVARSRRVTTGLLVVCATGILLTACIVTADQNIEKDRKDPRPPDLLDSIRAIDLSPRATNGGGVDAPNAVRAARPVVVVGNGGGQVNTPPPADSAGGSGFDLNFENAPITTVAKVILGDIWGMGYTIDPRIQGTVTLTSGRPVPKADLLPVLENALRMSNVAMVRDRIGYRLVPANDAVGAGTIDREVAEAGYGLSVVPLQYVSAPTIVKLLDGFGAKPNTIRADTLRNMAVIQGTAAERRSLIDAVLSFDADWMRGQSVGIFPVKNSVPEPMIAELEKIVDSGDGGLGQNLIKFQPISRMNSILVVARKPEYLKTAANWITRLDQSDTAGTNLKVYRLRHGSAKQIAALLMEIFQGRSAGTLDSASTQLAPGGGSTVSTSSSTLGGGGAFGGGGGAAGGGGPLQSLSAAPPTSSSPAASAAGAGSTSNANARTGALDNALGLNAGGLGGRGGAGTSGVMPNVRITADIANNAILVYANQEAQHIVAQTINQLDRPLRQVAIEATLAEVTLNDTLTYGVQFYLSSSNLGIFNTLAATPLSPVLPGFNFLIGSQASPHVVLNALHNVTDVKVLSNPSLVVLDNQAATLTVGDQVPISTGSATVLTTSNTVVNTISYQSTGIILNVTPRINSSGSIVLEIEQEDSEVSPTSTSGSLTPTISQRKIKSSISVPNGQTVLLGGLISDSTSKVVQGIPALDQLPELLSGAFSNRTTVRARTELIIFIRPTVIRDPVDARMVAEELRAKISGRFVGTSLPVTVLPAPSPH
jgi:general secretion pathway protein D